MEANVCHIRRCHMCGHVNESVEATVSKCSECGKSLAPFIFEAQQNMPNIPPLFFTMGLEPPPMYRPLYGLTAYWRISNQ